MARIKHFNDEQLMEITHFIALGIGAAGFSEGLLCAVPAVA